MTNKRTTEHVEECDRDILDNLEEESGRYPAHSEAKHVPKLWRNDDAPSPAEFAAAASRVAGVDGVDESDDDSWCPRLA